MPYTFAPAVRSKVIRFDVADEVEWQARLTALLPECRVTATDGLATTPLEWQTGGSAAGTSVSVLVPRRFTAGFPGKD